MLAAVLYQALCNLMFHYVAEKNVIFFGNQKKQELLQGVWNSEASRRENEGLAIVSGQRSCCLVVVLCACPVCLLYKAKLSPNFCLTLLLHFPLCYNFKAGQQYLKNWATNLDNIVQERDQENIRLLLMFGQNDFLIQPGLAKSVLGYPPSFFAKNLGG